MSVSFLFGGQKDYDHWEVVESFLTSYVDRKGALDYFEKNYYDKFMETIEDNRNSSRQPYSHEETFLYLYQSLDNVENLWITIVSIYSDYFVQFMDKLNIILNGGVFSPGVQDFPRYSSYSDRLQLLTILSMVVNVPSLEEDFMGYLQPEKMKEFLSTIRDEDKQKSAYTYLEDNLEEHIDCLYTSLAAKNHTFYNVFMEIVPKENLRNFTLDIVSEAITAINSVEAESNFRSLMAAVKKKVRQTDFDSLSSKMILVFMRVRSLVLGVNIQQVSIDLDRIHQTLGETWWKVSTGQWPEMSQFISSSIERTVLSEQFWTQVDSEYEHLVDTARQKYREGRSWLEDYIRTNLLTFLRTVKDWLETASTEDPSLLDNLVSRIQSVNTTSSLELGTGLGRLCSLP